MNSQTTRPVDIYRDGFSRTTLVRLVGTAGCCRWCGQYQRRTWDYWWQADDHPRMGRPTRAPGQETGPYCSISCYRADTGR